MAYPAYQEQVRSSRRADAQAALSAFGNAMERHYTEELTYEGAAAGGSDTGAPAIFPTEAPIDGGTKYYDLTIVSADGNSYTIQASPKGPQSDDGALQLDSTGARRWDTNNDGSFGSGEECWERSCS
ncbi:type IV pilin protein [Spiribacter halobius]|nr:type IV pilin protein [Spiribacter halobius]